MTENEAKSKLDSLHYKIIHTSFCNKVYESEIEALCLAKDVLQEIQQYRAIGTVEDIEKGIRQSEEEFDMLMEYRKIGTIEEFKDLKERNTTGLTKGEQLLFKQALIDGYINGVNEFAERLKSDEFQKYNLDMVFETSRDLSYSDCIDAFHEYIDEVSEQLKDGGENDNLDRK